MSAEPTNTTRETPPTFSPSEKNRGDCLMAIIQMLSHFYYATGQEEKLSTTSGNTKHLPLYKEAIRCIDLIANVNSSSSNVLTTRQLSKILGQRNAAILNHSYRFYKVAEPEGKGLQMGEPDNLGSLTNPYSGRQGLKYDAENIEMKARTPRHAEILRQRIHHISSESADTVVDLYIFLEMLCYTSCMADPIFAKKIYNYRVSLFTVKLNHDTKKVAHTLLFFLHHNYNTYFRSALPVFQNDTELLSRYNNSFPNEGITVDHVFYITKIGPHGQAIVLHEMFEQTPYLQDSFHSSLKKKLTDNNQRYNQHPYKKSDYQIRKAEIQTTEWRKRCQKNKDHFINCL